MRRALLAFPLLLGACGDPGGDYPALVPIESLLAPRVPAHATAAADSPVGVAADVRAAGTATRSRAAAVGDPVPSDDALRARANALRARADALRQAEPGV